MGLTARKRVKLGGPFTLNASASKRNGVGASLSIGTNRRKKGALNVTYNSRGKTTISLYGTGIRWTSEKKGKGKTGKTRKQISVDADRKRREREWDKRERAEERERKREQKAREKAAARRQREEEREARAAQREREKRQREQARANKLEASLQKKTADLAVKFANKLDSIREKVSKPVDEIIASQELVITEEIQNTWDNFPALVGKNCKKPLTFSIPETLIGTGRVEGHLSGMLDYHSNLITVDKTLRKASIETEELINFTTWLLETEYISSLTPKITQAVHRDFFEKYKKTSKSEERIDFILSIFGFNDVIAEKYDLFDFDDISYDQDIEIKKADADNLILLASDILIFTTDNFLDDGYIDEDEAELLGVLIKRFDRLFGLVKDQLKSSTIKEVTEAISVIRIELFKVSVGSIFQDFSDVDISEIHNHEESIIQTIDFCEMYRDLLGFRSDLEKMLPMDAAHTSEFKGLLGSVDQSYLDLLMALDSYIGSDVPEAMNKVDDIKLLNTEISEARLIFQSSKNIELKINESLFDEGLMAEIDLSKSIASCQDEHKKMETLLVDKLVKEIESFKAELDQSLIGKSDNGEFSCEGWQKIISDKQFAKLLAKTKKWIDLCANKDNRGRLIESQNAKLFVLESLIKEIECLSEKYTLENDTRFGKAISISWFGNKDIKNLLISTRSRGSNVFNTSVKARLKKQISQYKDLSQLDDCSAYHLFEENSLRLYDFHFLNDSKSATVEFYKRQLLKGIVKYNKTKNEYKAIRALKKTSFFSLGTEQKRFDLLMINGAFDKFEMAGNFVGAIKATINLCREALNKNLEDSSTEDLKGKEKLSRHKDLSLLDGCSAYQLFEENSLRLNDFHFLNDSKSATVKFYKGQLFKGIVKYNQTRNQNKAIQALKETSFFSLNTVQTRFESSLIQGAFDKFEKTGDFVGAIKATIDLCREVLNETSERSSTEDLKSKEELSQNNLGNGRKLMAVLSKFCLVFITACYFTLLLGASLSYESIYQVLPIIGALGGLILWKKNSGKLSLMVVCCNAGIIGLHRFLIGKPFSGILMLWSVGGFGLWWLIDIFMIYTNRLHGAPKSVDSK